MLMGDVRLYRAMNANLGGTAGLGVRQFLPGPNKVLGVSGFYDLDDTRDIEFQQLSLSLELLGENWDLRANGYMPIDDTVESGNVRIQQDSERFAGNRLLFTQLTDVSAAANGVDVTGTIPLRAAAWMEAIDLEASAGYYHFQAADAATEKVNGGRIRFDAGFFGELVHTSLDITSDNVFDSNLMFTASIDYHAGLKAMRGRGSQKNRFSEWHRRNWTVTAITDTVADNNIAAVNPDDNDSYNIVHVSNNVLSENGRAGSGLTYPDFDPTAALGTFENPFESLQQALQTASATTGGPDDIDIVYTRAASEYSDADFDDEFIVPTGVRVLGEGFVTDGPGNREVTHTVPLQNFALQAELPNPTNVLLADLEPDNPFILALGTPFPERPSLTGLNEGDFAVQLSNQSEFSGWQIINSQTARAALYVNDVVNGATRDNGVELGALSQDVSILGGIADGLLIEDAVGVMDFQNLRIGRIGSDPIDGNGNIVGDAPITDFVVDTPQGIGLHIVGGTPQVRFFGDNVASIDTATSIVAKTDFVDVLTGQERDYAVLIENTAPGANIDLSEVAVIDGAGFIDANNDGFLNVLDDRNGDGLFDGGDSLIGGRGILVGTDNEELTPQTFGIIRLGRVETGFGVGNTPGSGVAISQFGGNAILTNIMNIDSAGRAPSGPNAELDGAALRFSDFSGPASVLTADGTAPITITNRGGTGIEFRRISEGSNVAATGAIDIALLSDVTIEDFVDIDGIPDAAVNFQENGGDVVIASLDIDNNSNGVGIIPSGPGINIGVRDVVGSPELRNQSTASFSIGDLTLEDIGTDVDPVTNTGGFANIQVLNDPTTVDITTTTIDNRLGRGYEIFQTTGTIGLGSVQIEDLGVGNGANTQLIDPPVFASAVDIQEVGNSVSFAVLDIDDSSIDSVRGDSVAINPYETGPFTIDGGTFNPDLTGYNVVNPLVNIRNNTLGGDGATGAAVNLGTFNVDSDDGQILYALNNRQLTIDGGVIDADETGVGGQVYIANTYDLDIQFDQYDVEGTGELFGLRVINAGLPGGGASIVIDPNVNDLNGAGGTLDGGVTGNGIWLTDVDGDFFFRSLEIDGWSRGIFVENNRNDEPIDFLLTETFPSLAPDDADPNEPLFDTTNSPNVVTSGTVTFSTVNNAFNEGIRLRNVQGFTLDNSELENNLGRGLGNEQVLIEIFNTDGNVASNDFEILVNNTVLTSTIVGGVSSEFEGLLDIEVAGSSEDSRLLLDVIDSEFNINDTFSSGVRVETVGTLQPNPNTNLGFSGNTFNGNALSAQRAISLRQSNDEVTEDSVVAIFNNLVDLGGGATTLFGLANNSNQTAFFLDFEHALNLRIAGQQTSPGVVGAGGGVRLSGDDDIAVDLILGSEGNQILIEDNTFQFDEDFTFVSVFRGVRFQRIGGPSTVTIQDNTFDVANGNFFDGGNDRLVEFDRVDRDPTLLGNQITLFSGQSNTVLFDGGDPPIFVDFGVNDAFNDFTGNLIFNNSTFP